MTSKKSNSYSMKENDNERNIQFLLVITCVRGRFRGGSRAAVTSKMECFGIIVNGRKPLTFITKLSILDVAAALDPHLRFGINLPS